MQKYSLYAAAISLSLVLAACGNNVPNGGDSNTPTGNTPPSVTILTSNGKKLGAQTLVAPVPQFKLQLGDSDGRVTAVDWQISRGTVTVAKGSVASTDIKAQTELNLPSLGGGTYTLTVTATDNLGATNSATTAITVDDQPPLLAGVQIDGVSVPKGGTVDRLVGATAILTVSTTDNASSPSVLVYRGNTLIARGTGSVSTDLTGSGAGIVPYTVIAVDTVGNTTTQTFTVNYTVTSQETPAPKPIIIINNTGAQPYSNILSVTVSAGVAAGVGVKQLILEVTDSKGIVDTTTYTATTENVTFNIDTTKYPDGPLKLRVIAVDGKDQRATSSTTEVQVANSVAPTITVVSPSPEATVSGPTAVTVQIRQNNTAFTFTDSKVNFDIIDSRGQLVTTQSATVSQVNQGLWQATTSIDFNATQYINGNYTVRARSDVTLQGQSTTRSITAVTTVKNLSNVDESPALNILLPVFFDSAGQSRATLTRKSAVAIQVSDSDAVRQVNLRFTCDDATKLPGQICNTSAYNFNLPVGAPGLNYVLFNTGVLIDGQPFVPDGYYVMRATATDAAGNSNIKEIPIEVNRSKIGTLGLGDNITSTFEDNTSKFTPALATWSISGLPLNTTRVITFTTIDGSQGVGIESEHSANNAIDTTFSFRKAGSYKNDYLVQDMVTGVVEYYPGATVIVAEK